MRAGAERSIQKQVEIILGEISLRPHHTDFRTANHAFSREKGNNIYTILGLNTLPQNTLLQAVENASFYWDTQPEIIPLESLTISPLTG